MQTIQIIEGTKYITHSTLQFGDYGGAGSVGAANIRDIKRENTFVEIYMSDIDNDYRAPLFDDMPAPDVISAVGAYGSETVYVRSDIWEANEYDCLDDYPLLSDETHSDIEMQWEREAFTDYASHDLYRDLPERNMRKLDMLPSEQNAEFVWAAYRAAMEECNEYPTPEYSSSHIPVDEIQNSFNAQVIKLLKNETPSTQLILPI